mgnify:CR=1 FL=1
MQGILGEGEAGDHAVVVCLKDVFAEVHLPDTKQLVLPAGDAETGTDHEAADGCVVVEFVDLFEFSGGVVDLEKQSCL